jgi:hypothetical protein
MSGLAGLGNLWHTIRAWLFPVLEDEMGELDGQQREFVAVCEICASREQVGAYRWVGNGCPAKDWLALCKAFIGKGRAFGRTAGRVAGEYTPPETRRVGQECPTYCQKDRSVRPVRKPKCGWPAFTG